MPSVISYEVVLRRLADDGLRCAYPNGGAFRPADEGAATTVAWVVRPDPTIRPAALAVCRQVDPPAAPTLARLARAAWLTNLPGPAWVLPGSHWAYELDSPAAEWLAPLLVAAGVDADALKHVTQGVAIECRPADADAFEAFVGGLLDRLDVSDFYLAFPGWRTVCMVHHHQQLWWTTTEAGVARGLDRVLVKG